MSRSTSLTLLFVFVTLMHITAAHIVGGDVTYSCISSDPITKTTRFNIIFTMYRDAAGGGANFDMPADFGIYQKLPSATVWQHNQTIMSIPINREDVTYGDDCVVLPPNLRVEKANYEFEIELPWGEVVYQIAYQRCCRNNTINNILEPASTGAVFYVEIFGNAIKDCNNSPVFKNFPPLLICSNKPLNFDHSAIDSDGDILVYEFCTPLKSGGLDGAITPGDPTSCTGVIPAPVKCLPPFAEVIFGPGYSGSNPLNGSPQVTVNPSTGIISGTPTLLGQFVVGVCVKEYRNGVLIGTIRRDFQFNVAICQGISQTKNYTLCHNDSIIINDITYIQGGSYTQIFQTIEGCDSTLNIVINKLPKGESTISQTLCFGEIFTLNNQAYTTSGTYFQTVQNGQGCDSTINIFVNVRPKSESSLAIQLCDDETAIVNDVLYKETGSFTQNLKNGFDCDSTLIIHINKGISSSKSLHFSLCNQSIVVYNNQSYTEAGKYTQNLVTTTGCDSVVVINVYPCEQYIHFDFEKCDALVPVNSMVYDEFVPTYTRMLNCGKVVSTNIYREEPAINKHSCTQGFDNSIAMCVSASKTCDYAQTDAKPIVFEFKTKSDSGFDIGFNHLVFYHKSPLNFSWISGASGLNNYPKVFGLRILKNGTEVYRKIGITTSNDWKQEKFDFFGDDIFVTTDSSNFRIEITPYCVVGNSGAVNVWDIDNVSVYLSCRNKNNRILAGSIINPNDKIAKTEIRRAHNNIMIATPMKADGSFMMDKNNVLQNYSISSYCNDFTDYGLTTFDIVLTQRHILELEKFISPLQYLAADVNKDQKVTAADLLEMRKIILGISDKFQHHNSWMFVDENSFNTESDPWKIKDFILVSPGSTDLKNIKFRAIKIGDVSGITNRLLGNSSEKK